MTRLITLAILTVVAGLSIIVTGCGEGPALTPAKDQGAGIASAARPKAVVPQPGSPSEQAAKPISLHLLTWNIQYGSNAGPDSNDWPQRKALVAAVLQAEAPDVFCGQEVLPDQLAALKEALVGYGVVAVGRDGPDQGEHAPVFFRNDRFDCLASGTFWYNEDTTKPGKDWDKEYNRICTWVELRDKDTGRAFRIWNSHFPLGANARVKAAALLVRKLKETKNVPAVLTGDFNEPMGPEKFPALHESGFEDAYVHAEKKLGIATFRWKGIGVTRIDWILTSPGWAVHELRTVDKAANTSAGGSDLHASDHNALSGQLILPPSP